MGELRERDPKAADWGELFHQELKSGYQQQNYEVVWSISAVLANLTDITKTISSKIRQEGIEPTSSDDSSTNHS